MTTEKGFWVSEITEDVSSKSKVLSEEQISEIQAAVESKEQVE